MVGRARFFLEFRVEESWGKCPPCRIGGQILFNILDRITKGEGRIEDLDVLESLGGHIQRSSLCGLGQTAPNAVLSTVRHFREEYEAHVFEQRCPAAQCRALLTYVISPEMCNGCTLCAEACPTSAISGRPKHVHHVEQDLCVHCGACLNACPTTGIVAT
jgi:NADP-reducing hydrogenase subunit HndC